MGYLTITRASLMLGLAFAATSAQAQSIGTAPAGSAPPPSSVQVREARAYALRQARNEVKVAVPPALEIEVLDPNVDPLGNPAVLTKTNQAGKFVIDIPPAVLVHRYYYTGERSFQGPMIPGGPTILVMNHPRNGERLYVETQMLPGAPRVKYTSSSIEYDYESQAIILKFGHHGKPTVTYRQGVPLAIRIKQGSARRHEKLDNFVQRTGIPTAGGKIREVGKNVAETTADRIKDVGTMAFAPVIQIVKATPLGNAFTSSPEDRATKARDGAVQRAQQTVNSLGADIPTVR